MCSDWREEIMKYSRTGMALSERVFQYIKIRQHRNKKILLTAGISLVCCIFAGILLFQGKSPKAAETDTGFKSYTSIEIKSGDSLWSIASEYMTDDYDSIQEYVRDIKSLNGLGSDEIHAGKFLLVPYYIP